MKTCIHLFQPAPRNRAIQNLSISLLPDRDQEDIRREPSQQRSLLHIEQTVLWNSRSEDRAGKKTYYTVSFQKPRSKRQGKRYREQAVLEILSRKDFHSFP